MGIKSVNCDAVHRLADEAREKGVTRLPSIPDVFNEPEEVIVWIKTVRRRIALFLAGVTDASGQIIEKQNSF